MLSGKNVQYVRLAFIASLNGALCPSTASQTTRLMCLVDLILLRLFSRTKTNTLNQFKQLLLLPDLIAFWSSSPLK